MRSNINMQSVLGGALMEPTKVWPEHGAAEERAVLRALHGNDWGIESSEPEAAELAFCRMLGAPETFASVSTLNGTVVIQQVLEALGIGFNDRVIVPGMTWQATAGAVLDVNAVPVILDCGRDWTLDVDLVEWWLKEKQGTPEMPKAVIAVHLMNRVADVRRLFEVCREYDVWLLEDNAQGVGASVEGRPLMTFGAVGMTSQQSSKPYSTGEGGKSLTAVPGVEARLRQLRSCGRPALATIPDGVAGDRIVEFWREKWSRATAADPLLRLDVLQSGNYRDTAIIAALGGALTERFAEQRAERERGLAALDAVMPGVEGIRWHSQQPWVTSPVAYRIGFGYDPEAFGGMSNELFRAGLAHLLGKGRNQKVEALYEPLNNSPYYQPHSKKRHHLSPEYVQAIDPGQWDLPMATAIYQRAVTIEQSALREATIGEVLPTAIRTLQANARQLVAAARRR